MAASNWRLMDEYVDRLKAVTPEQVQAVAKKYLIDDRLTVAVMEPDTNQSSAPSSAAAMGGRYAH